MIYIYFGLPGAGKSYMGTRNVYLELSKRKHGRPQYTNWPIRIGNKFSLFWDFNLVHENIFDSDIHMDEAYRDVNSRDWKSFDQDTHLFFATNRHNGNNIFLYTQSPARIDKVIREIAVFYWIQPFKIPIIGRPIWFRIEVYEDEQNLAERYKKGTRFKKFRIKFEKKIAKAYDTHQFRKNDDKPFIPTSWDKILGIEIPKEKPRFSLFKRKEKQDPITPPPPEITPEQMKAIEKIIRGTK